MSKIAAFLLPRLRTVLIFAAIAAAVYAYVGYNHARQTALEATLAGGAPAAQDAAVSGLVGNGRLVDVLINTQNPDEDVSSPSNQRSLLIRKNAAAAVNRLSAAAKITAGDAFDTLFLLCKDANADVKASAESGLTALGQKSDANLRSVVDRLSNGDPDIRGAAVDVLGKIGGAKTAALVNGALINSAAQDSAISALQGIGAPSVPLIIAHLEDPAAQNDVVFRQQMVSLLDQIAAPSSVPELIKITGQPGQPSVQRPAQVALADIVLSAYQSEQTDRTALAAAKDPAARASAETTLAAASAALPEVQKAEPTLRGVLTDTAAASESRSQAALALGQIGGAAAVAALVNGLGDFDAQVRASSETGLQASGPAAVGPLTAALAGSDATQRAGAAQALGGIGSPAATSALVRLFQNRATPDSVRESIVIGLGRSGSPSVIPALVSALGDTSGGVAGAAQTGLLTPALAKPAIPALVAALSGRTPVPFNAAETLARMGALAESDAVPLLVRSIQTGSTPTQTWAAVALGEIGSKTPSAMSALQGLSKSADPKAQYAASQSLLKLSEGA